MTTRKTKQPAVGDRGQRYEIWCDDEDGQPMQMGWSNNPESMKQAVEKHPCWKNHRAVDRLGAAAADNGTREPQKGPRSSAARGSERHWLVVVTVDNEEILQISGDHVSGVENIEDFANEVMTCAEHLAGFIGGRSGASPNAKLCNSPEAARPPGEEGIESR